MPAWPCDPVAPVHLRVGRVRHARLCAIRQMAARILRRPTSAPGKETVPRPSVDSSDSVEPVSEIPVVHLALAWVLSSNWVLYRQSKTGNPSPPFSVSYRERPPRWYSVLLLPPMPDRVSTRVSARATSLSHDYECDTSIPPFPRQPWESDLRHNNLSRMPCNTYMEAHTVYVLKRYAARM